VLLVEHGLALDGVAARVLGREKKEIEARTGKKRTQAHNESKARPTTS
jgi:hypothetical protein